MLRNRLAELMEERNLMMKQLAAGEGNGNLTGLAHNTLSVIKNNKREGIDLNTLETLCRTLGFTPNDFFVFDPPLSAMENKVETLSKHHRHLLDLLGDFGLAGVIEAGATHLAPLVGDKEVAQEIKNTLVRLKAR